VTAARTARRNDAIGTRRRCSDGLRSEPSSGALLGGGRRDHIPDAERKDRFGRTLAYVYLPDGIFLNAEIVKQGYGHAYMQFPFRYSEQFQGYEREAREANRGLWAAN
jgi:endonuclease YncB( thermonuclease family)